jgi:aminoglycoside phosphotransferase
MRSEPSTKLPNILWDQLKDYSWSKHPYNKTTAEIYVLNHPTEQTVYLKINRKLGQRPLEHESKIIQWINNRIPTPQLLFYGCDDKVEYLLTTEVTGTPTYLVKSKGKANAVKILAKTLKTIHSLDPSDCPIDNSINKLVIRLKTRGINISTLGNWKPSETLVFTHGDYCLPNIIVDEVELSGVIDWDYAGLVDPYTDFASCIWSLGYNYGEKETRKKWVPLFFNHYGLDAVDEKKLSFYMKLIDLM